MAEFFLELFSEEIPARFQKQAMEDLRKLFTEGLSAQNLEFGEVKTFVTARRLGLVVEGLPVESAPREEERKGPKVGAPEAAVSGFLKSAGLTSLDQCKQIETPKGNFWIAVTKVPAQKTEIVLPQILWNVLHNFPWKKSQNWAEGSFRWVRPLRSIIAIFDGKILPYYVYLGDGSTGTPASMNHIDNFDNAKAHSCIKISNVTEGHRFMSSGKITVESYNDYVQKMLAAKVLIDRDERKKKIRESAQKILSAKNTFLKDDEGLLEEVSGLTEWPVPLIGNIDQQFMEVPPEVLITTMRNNQKYFSVVDAEGAMQPSFIITANLETADNGAAIIAGNERVLRARFSDAKFFWDLDRKETLESRLTQLSSIVFHAKLGSMAEKVTRLEYLSTGLGKLLSGHAEIAKKETEIKRASLLAKADLVTGMVGEFPELQGIMGGYYAQHDGETKDVATAVKEHYSPLGPGDTCPTAPVSIIVAMADKIDVLVGFFSIDEKPTGSKDPYALRRAALGILRLIIENGLRFNIKDALKLGYQAYQQKSENAAQKFLPEEKVLDDLILFFADRLKAMLREKNMRHDIIDSVFTNNITDIAGQIEKLEALQKTLLTEEGQAVVALYNRAANILRIEEKKDKKSYSAADLNEKLLVETEEKELQGTLVRVLPSMKSAIASEDYQKAMTLLVSLRGPVYSFFDKITVNAESPDMRANRLTLISQLRDAVHEIADFSLLEGAGK